MALPDRSSARGLVPCRSCVVEPRRAVALPVIERLVPQWLAVVVCAALGHRQRRFSAWADGTQVVVYTCRCGRRQDTSILPANRAIRRLKRS